MHRCQIRALRAAAGGAAGHTRGATGLVALGLDVHGFTTSVTWEGRPARGERRAERPALTMSHRKWRDGAGNVVAQSGKARGGGSATVAEVEFVAGVEEDVRDLVVAAWVAGVWLRGLVPKMRGRLQDSGVVGGAAAGDGRRSWGWRPKEQFPLRDEFIKMGWKENEGRGVT